MLAKPVTCSDQLFKGRQFKREVIILCVRWYLRFKLSFRDLVEMMAERGVSLAHTTIMRWVQRFMPEFERRWNRFARQAGQSWRVDETTSRSAAIEQDHRGIKARIGPMLGFKRFRRAKVAIAGIELLHPPRNKFNLGKFLRV